MANTLTSAELEARILLVLAENDSLLSAGAVRMARFINRDYVEVRAAYQSEGFQAALHEIYAEYLGGAAHILSRVKAGMEDADPSVAAPYVKMAVQVAGLVKVKAPSQIPLMAMMTDQSVPVPLDILLWAYLAAKYPIESWSLSVREGYRAGTLQPRKPGTPALPA